MRSSASQPADDPAAARVPSQRLSHFLAALVLMLLAGCVRSGQKADVTVVNGPEADSLDPHVLTAQADGRVALALFEGLVRYNPTNALPEPGLAERWEISPDRRHYTFHLRPNARWSNGEPLTSADFLYSWRRALEPKTACENAGLLYYIRHAEAFNQGTLADFARVGVRAEGPAILHVELENPTTFFLDLCAYVPYVAVHRATLERFGDRWLLEKPFVSSGAFTLVSWRLNDKIRLRKNPNYWDASSTRSEIIDVLPCVVPSTALNLYETGAADIVWDKELVPSDLLDVVVKRPDFHRYHYLGLYFFRFNVTRKPLDDPRVRQALALVIDKQRIVDRITRAQERVADFVTPYGTLNGTVPYVPPAGLRRDTEAARRLLAAAGFPEGRGFPQLDYVFNTQKAHEQIAVEMRDMWKRELGITVNLKQMEYKTFLRAQSRLEYDISRSSWIADYNDPNTFLDLFMSGNPNNRTGWTNAAYNRLLLDANREPDTAKRQVLLRNAESILVEQELPVVPLYFYVGLEYYDTHRISGVFPNLKAEHPLRSIGRVKSSRAQRAGF